MKMGITTSTWRATSGVSKAKKADKFLPLLSLRAPIVPAELKNEAGIVGAAWHAEHLG